MATAIKIYSTDTNQNMVSKTVSNANPAVSDYVLKNFSQQLVSLSENSFSRAERIDTKDITSATEGGDIAAGSFVLASSSPFFSNDSDTFTAAISELEIPESQPGGINFWIGGNNVSRDINLSLYQIKKLKTFSELVDALNYSAYDSVSASKRINFEEGNRKVTVETIKPPLPNLTYAQLMINLNDTRTDAAKNFVKSIGENLIQVSGFTAVYNEHPAFENIMRIYITRN